jgi:hypothetical protein
MEHHELIRLIAANPADFAWFLGAGASQSANLPTAWDIIWDLKRREYNLRENQQIPKSDVQNRAVQEKIQGYFEGRGFPRSSDPNEYSRYFELIFGADLARQRKYVHGMLDESKVALAVGHRVLAALLCSERAKVVFTTNFDTVVEKALAEVGDRSLAAFHLEGSYAVNDALNAAEYPVYCKLHGDFRYQSIKNLPDDLRMQDVQLGHGLITACNQFGLIVAGYSGRDLSVIELLRKALESHNPFPHGLFWTKMKGTAPLGQVSQLIEFAKGKGVSADFVEIETFDALMSRIWRQLEPSGSKLDVKVRRALQQKVEIEVPRPGTGRPLLRSNALRIERMPQSCLQLFFKTEQGWDDLKEAQQKAGREVLCTMSDGIFAWGRRGKIASAFSADLASVETFDLDPLLAQIDTLTHVKAFVEEAVCRALIRGKPLLLRRWRTGWAVIVDRTALSTSTLERLRRSVSGALGGELHGKFSTTSEEHPKPEQLAWAEAVQIDLEVRNGANFLLLRPDVWIWPRHAREDATSFLDERRGNRYNAKANEILTEWIKILLPQDDAGHAAVNLLEGVENEENPTFVISSATAVAGRVAA